MRRFSREQLRVLAHRCEHINRQISIGFGVLVGMSLGLALPWGAMVTLGAFQLLLVGALAVTILSAQGHRVAPGDWRSGLRLTAGMLFRHTTIFGGLALALTSACSLVVPEVDWSAPALLLRSVLPNFYGFGAVASLFSAPIYLRWLA